MKQKSLKNPVVIKGIGLHSGCASVLTINPAPSNTGIVFKRSDLENAVLLPATYNQVADTRNCTCLGKEGQIVSTIEHLMAALYVAEIDNALIECSNQELPIMDGSAAVFYDILQRAEKVEQDVNRSVLKILKTVRFEDEKGNYIELQPSDKANLSVHFEIEFPSKIVGHQIFEGEITKDVFLEKVAPCRTFCEKYQIDYLRSIGLIKGGSLDNAVVLDGETILNPGGFKVENECVNHKVLDAIGDMYTSGYRIIGKVHAFRTGHFHNNEVLKKLFSDKSGYELI